MPHQTKLPPGDKIKLVKACLAGEISQKKAAAQVGVSIPTVRGWVRLYQAEGEAGLYPRAAKQGVSQADKLAAVKEYLAGQGSLYEICKKYKIRNTNNLEKWVAAYQTDQRIPPTVGAPRYKPHAYTTVAQRNAIAQECLDGGCNYRQIAEKYGVSYAAVVNWVQAYQKTGAAARRAAYHEAGGITAQPHVRREVPPLQRLTMVLDCLEHQRNYAATAKKYGLSYNQIAKWVGRYQRDGWLGMRTRRGPTPKEIEARQRREQARLDSMTTDQEAQAYLAALQDLPPDLLPLLTRAGYTPPRHRQNLHRPAVTKTPGPPPGRPGNFYARSPLPPPQPLP